MAKEIFSLKEDGDGVVTKIEGDAAEIIRMFLFVMDMDKDVAIIIQTASDCYRDKQKEKEESVIN